MVIDGWITTLFRLSSYPLQTYWLRTAVVMSPVGFSSSAPNDAAGIVSTVNMSKPSAN